MTVTDTAHLAHGDVVCGCVNVSPRPPPCYDVLCNMDALMESVIGGDTAVYMCIIQYMHTYIRMCVCVVCVLVNQSIYRSINQCVCVSVYV